MRKTKKRAANRVKANAKRSVEQTTDERQEPVIPDAPLSVEEDERNLRSQSREPAGPVRIAGRKKTGSRDVPGDRGLRLLPILLLGLLAVGLAYSVWSAKSQLAQNEQFASRLDAASQRIAALETELSRADQNLSESDSAFAGFSEKLGTLEHEVRKLWDVSNKRNKQWIQDNQAALEKLQQADSDLDGQLGAFGKQLDQIQAERKQEAELAAELRAGLEGVSGFRKEMESLQAQYAELKKSATAMREESASAHAELQAAVKKAEDGMLSMQARSDQLNAQLTRVNTAVTRLEQKIAASGGGSEAELEALRAAMAENEQAVRSFDAFRRQTNQSITSLQTAVGNLQKQN